MADPQTRQRLLEGLGAGVAATLVMTGACFAVPAFHAASLPWFITRALGDLAEHPSWLALALAAHLAYGGLAGALYFGSAQRVTVRGGVLFGLALWGVAMAVYAPLVGFAATSRPQLALLALPAHLLYGLALAAFAPRGEILQTT